MNLTAATLATMLKYPEVPSKEKTSNPERRERGKWSVMSSEAHHYERVHQIVGLEAGDRHPLSFVVEAADDIVNRLVDIEDAMKVGLVSFEDVCDALASVPGAKAQELKDQMVERRDELDQEDREMLAYQRFRVNAGAALAESCEDLFENKVAQFESSKFGQALVEACALGELYRAIESLEKAKIFGDSEIVRVEAGGKAAISKLLNLLYDEVRVGSKLGVTVPRYISLDHEDEDTELIHVRRVVDYVSGMTDRFAVTLYQQLSGISL